MEGTLESTGENIATLYRYYRQTIKNFDDLRLIVGHLPGFMEIADRNNREVIIEIWLRKKETS
jgi:hypothetical protein